MADNLPIKLSVEEILLGKTPPVRTLSEAELQSIPKISYGRFVAIVDEPHNPNEDPASWAGQPGFDVMIRHLKRKAEKGDLKAIQMVLDWRIGKAVQRTEVMEVKGGPAEWQAALAKHQESINQEVEHARKLEAERWVTKQPADSQGDIVDVDVSPG